MAETIHSEKNKAERVSLKVLQCPNCGASLKAKNSTDPITCVFCDSTVVPLAESNGAQSKGTADGAVRVEGIKTSSSALAYIELFFEEYDWDAFAYAQTLSVAQIDTLVDSLKQSSADDKNTWLACFMATAVPVTRKISGCQKILADVIGEYKKDNLDAYSLFDAYKRIAAMLCVRTGAIVEKLEKITAKAEKYGASAAELDALKEQTAYIRTNAAVPQYAQLESIPEVKAFAQEKNARIVAELAARGIQAESEYTRAKALVEQGRYQEALTVLLALNGYADTEELIEKLDKYYLLSDVLEVEGKQYFFKRNAKNGTLSLYPTADGKILGKAILKNIGQIVTNYADVLYYLDGGGKMRRYVLSTGAENKIPGKRFDKKTFFVYGRKVFLLEQADGDTEADLLNIAELDLAAGTLKRVVENVQKAISLTGNKLVYTKIQKTDKKDGEEPYRTVTCVINVDTGEKTELGDKKEQVEGFVGELAVFTREAPDKNNRNLYVKAVYDQGQERLLEQNIFAFCDIIAGRLFYYVGNAQNRSLININSDGSGRQEWPRLISRVLFEQGGWLYFIRRSGYNAILCKSLLDGTKYAVVADDIEEFVEIKNGYLYYINDEQKLVKVRMDGSNRQTLCDNVETVLSVRENKIIFVSVDSVTSSSVLEQIVTKTIKSIYAVEFSGSGKIKLAYDVQKAAEYDNNTVYYIAEKAVDTSEEGSEKKQKLLFKLDAQTNRAEQLLVLDAVGDDNKLTGVVIALVIMVFAFFLALIGVCAQSVGLVVFGLMVGFAALLGALCLKFGSKLME